MQRITIQEGTIGLVFRNGEFSRTISEGTYWIFPFETVVQFEKDNRVGAHPVSDAWVQKRIQAVHQSLLSK
ncbi:MAG: SPFH domain-containing protein [Reichenbachiella sp.]|uniref:SPFH domain-containing protein n=1 Tax=Reichenbachiella sp. TaxID=2184521 RepID=UPI003262F98F